jgi:hypothetical protein
MAKCFKCRGDTVLFENGVPIFIKCGDERDDKIKVEKDQRIRGVLLQDLLET